MVSSVLKSQAGSEPVQAKALYILAFTAPIEGRRAAVSTAVAQRLKAPRVSFGGYLRKVAQQKGLQVTREALQSLGDAMIREDIQAFCTEVLRQEALRPDAPLVVDGVRHREVLKVIRELLARPAEYLIFIDVDRATQTRRLEAETMQFQADDLPHKKPLEELEQHPTEVQVRSILPDHADLILNGALPVEELVAKVVKFVSNPPHANERRSWDQKNVRRIELARRRTREGLTAAELSEFDQLQTSYSDYLNAKYPRKVLDASRLDAIEARLEEGEKPSGGG